MFTPPKPEEWQTESDVEQKLAWPLLTSPAPHGLGFAAAEIFSKPNIREFEIGKGTSAKLYYPDYLLTFLGLPVLVVEAKEPGQRTCASGHGTTPVCDGI